MKRLFKSIICSLLLSTIACGGGGGGSGESDSGNLSLKVEPDKVVSGGLAFVSVDFDSIRFDDIDSGGLLLKLLVPTQLDIKMAASAIMVNGEALHLTPIYVGPASKSLTEEIFAENDIEGSGANSGDNGYTLYVFELDTDLIDIADSGHIELQFEVDSLPLTPVIFADLDRGDSAGFDPTHPNFDSEADARFEVLPPGPGSAQ